MHQKDYINIRPKAPRVRAKDFIPTLPLLGLQTLESAGASFLKSPGGVLKYPSQVAPTTGSLILVPWSGIADWETDRVVTPWRSWKGAKSQEHHLPRDCRLYQSPSPRTLDPLLCQRDEDHYNWPPSRPHLVPFYARETRIIITDHPPAPLDPLLCQRDEDHYNLPPSSPTWSPFMPERRGSL